MILSHFLFQTCCVAHKLILSNKSDLELIHFEDFILLRINTNTLGTMNPVEL